MVMDKPLMGLYGSVNGLSLDDENLPGLSDHDLVNGFKLDHSLANQNYARIPPLPLDPNPSNSAIPSSTSQDGDLPEDFDFSDVVLKYISDMLMEENMEEKACMFQESSAALQAAEKSLYELIGKEYPNSASNDATPHFDRNDTYPDDKYDSNYSNGSTSSKRSTSGSNIVDPGWNCVTGEHRFLRNASRSTSHSSHSSSNSLGTFVDGFADSTVSTLRISEIFSDNESIMQFKKGFEEASKFIPSGGSFVDLEGSGLFFNDVKEDANSSAVKQEEKRGNTFSLDSLRGKKNPHSDNLNLEGDRSNKQSAIYTEPPVSSADFDRVLLNCGSESALRVALQNGKNKNADQDGRMKGTTRRKSRGKKQRGKSNVVDLRTLLTLCAQAVGADDRRSANDLLKQIRQNASPTGDGMQRLAHIFADGLEARLAGSGTEIYKAFITRFTSAADVLKAHHLFLAVCPFKKLSYFFSNRTIMNAAEKATRLHIVDFGIMYGFQWPCLIQRLSSRPGGPPILRITGIDLPTPGFRPAERVEETGRRLANYARTFNVPFHFNAIAQKWDTIKIEDLKIDRDEVLVVNVLNRLRNLLDETVVVESPRNIVLNLIKKMRPDVFIVEIVNGAFGAPFFITRFREALFHYSTWFDMLETNMPREIPERMLIEREIVGREAMNVIACEGAERMERPETYKQWQVRITRAGFKQLPLNQEILKTAKGKVNELYHKDFVIDDDSQWLLQGWKGRILYALSSWKPDS